ncbi:MAG: hypothetical protein ACI4D9_02580 [Lachnospiraceae bacterium]
MDKEIMDTEEIEEQDISVEEENTDSMTTERDPFMDRQESDESKKGRRFFRQQKEDANLLRDKWILSKIRDEDLMEYLALEQKRSEQIQNAKDIHEKRIITSFQMTVSLIAGVMVVYLLKDNPTILVNIIYISGILGAFWIWKKSRKN